MLILNNMYVGGYLMVGENIGHEVYGLTIMLVLFILLC